ncbi:TonB-dependent receptor plug domain-containing protein [Stenotrophomonas maltophilia]|uniref:TonB-dependent receptor plug domain-containing protein n=1 Tax=Stenotrophomonas maltophilia TaxID=40324 RepID=UPI0009AD76A8|nr:TonB-dependent receptor plug domain-containing protein [Stenotrophomonas maltophilia]QGL76571.1 hypothetical protein FEO95_13420 [Stenotrophomonas maltophilia]
MPIHAPQTARLPLAAALALCLLPAANTFAQDGATTLDSIQVSGSWLGTGLHDSVKRFAGARTVVDRQRIEASGAASIGDAMRRIPGVQVTDNSGTAGSSVSLNIGVRGLTGRYSPRSTVLLDGVPLAVAPYGQPQLSFAPTSLSNIESIDVVRGGGAVRYGPQNVGGIINFSTRAIPTGAGLHGEAGVRYTAYDHGGGDSTQYNAFLGGTGDNGLGAALLYSGQDGRGWRQGSDDRFNDLALKFAYAIDEQQELRAKLSYYDVRSLTPGGLTRAQYEADPFQNTRPTDFWKGHRTGIDLGYTNTLSANSEFEVLAYYNESSRASSLINAANTQLTVQPRDYRVLGIEPRYTQRLHWGASVHDITAGYRFLRERGNDRSFRIAPTFMQTVWFKLLCAAAILALLVLAVRIRSGQLAALFRARLQERHGERERIARDLHDTLLQGSQGLILRLHAISQSPQTSETVRGQLESAMQLAERNLAEGRERVNALRDGPFAGRDLASVLADVHAEYAGQGTNPLRLTVEGAPPPLQADAAEEVFLIGREAIRNALRHADARAIEVELSYGARCFLLHVRDDGVGIADENAARGHWGLQGMRERAQRLGADLQLWTRPGLGTEVALSVPARRLYHRGPSRWRWPWSKPNHD